MSQIPNLWQIDCPEVSNFTVFKEIILENESNLFSLGNVGVFYFFLKKISSPGILIKARVWWGWGELNFSLESLLFFTIFNISLYNL